MNECKHFHAPGVLHEPCKDCLIEHQATRIAELESRQVVSGAMCVIEGRCLSGEQYQRIKELEAALCEEVEARSKWYCEADRLKEELAAALRAAIKAVEQQEPVSDDKLLLRQVFSICEASEDECHGSYNAFERGRAFEAKRIRNGIGTWYQDTFCGKSFMGEPVFTTPQPAIPDGWVLVPAEPTPEMQRAMQQAEWPDEAYKAMLAAAPKEMK